VHLRTSWEASVFFTRIATVQSRICALARIGQKHNRFPPATASAPLSHD
jgi:hypothetical protein